jgi:hypothetical protein
VNHLRLIKSKFIKNEVKNEIKNKINHVADEIVRQEHNKERKTIKEIRILCQENQAMDQTGQERVQIFS